MINDIYIYIFLRHLALLYPEWSRMVQFVYKASYFKDMHFQFIDEKGSSEMHFQPNLFSRHL